MKISKWRLKIRSLDRIPGSGEPGSDQNVAGVLQWNIPSDNMFTTSREEDKKFEVFPEASMKSGPIFKTAEEYETYVLFKNNTKTVLKKFPEKILKNY